MNAIDPQRASSGSFFAIDKRNWSRVCDEGINAAAAYLTLGCGTGGDNRTTAWSINAVRNYSGMSLSRAQAAVQRLMAARLVKLKKGGTRPVYDIVPWQPKTGGKAATKPDHVWLPNQIVTSACGEVPPVELLRQTRDAMTLRLFVDLYHEQNLREDGGVSRAFLWQRHDRYEVGRQGPMTVWGFDSGSTWVRRAGPIEPHYRDMTAEELKDRSEADKRDGKKWTAHDAFRRIETLESLGLLDWIPHLFEGDDDDAEPIHPYGKGRSDTVEDRLGATANAAGRAMLTERQREWADDKGLWLAPVPHHFRNVQMIGIARMRYRPKTKMTAAWWADLMHKSQGYLDRYAALAGEPGEAGNRYRAPASV